MSSIKSSCMADCGYEAKLFVKVTSPTIRVTERVLVQWTFVMSCGLQNVLVTRLSSYLFWRFAGPYMQVGNSHKN